MRKWNMALALTPLAVGLLFSAARASSELGEHPCRADVQKYCPDIEPGGGRFLQCLEQHSDELSGACRQHVQHKQAALDRLRQICQPDVQKLCGDVPLDRDAFRCLREHRSEVSADCKDQLELAKLRHHRHHHHHDGNPAPSGTPS
jgi:hypothetical protein